MLKLVKNFINERTVLYWVENTETLEPVSEQFRTIAQAEEWWKEYMFSQYRGMERRTTFNDRRRDYDKRREMDVVHKNHTDNNGRRVTDMKVRVHIDLTANQ